MQKPFKEEYLLQFCKEVSDERVVKESCFSRVYEYAITHYTPYLESEIVENLLILDKSKRDDYLSYVIDKISKTSFNNVPENYIDKWLEKYDSNINEFPNFSNKELSDLLKMNYNLHYLDQKDKDLILDVQIDFYCYAAMKEVKKILNFVKSKYSNTGVIKETVEKSNKKQLTINQIVLLLQETGFFTHPKIERTTKVNQAKLVSKITGLNEKNIKTAIGKLDKKPQELGANYQNDIDKINDIIDNLE